MDRRLTDTQIESATKRLKLENEMLKEQVKNATMQIDLIGLHNGLEKKLKKAEKKNKENK